MSWGLQRNLQRKHRLLETFLNFWTLQKLELTLVHLSLVCFHSSCSQPEGFRSEKQQNSNSWSCIVNWSCCRFSTNEDRKSCRRAESLLSLSLEMFLRIRMLQPVLSFMRGMPSGPQKQISFSFSLKSKKVRVGFIFADRASVTQADTFIGNAPIWLPKHGAAARLLWPRPAYQRRFSRAGTPDVGSDSRQTRLFLMKTYLLFSSTFIFCCR